jgi:glutamine amidotransferase
MCKKIFKKPQKSDILIYDNTYPRILEEIWYTETPLVIPKLNEFEPTLELGLIPGKVVPIPTTDSFNYPQKIPHVGCNSLMPTEIYKSWQGTLLRRIKPGESVYFVHSHRVLPSNQRHRLAETRYGGHVIVAAAAKDNIVGFQFHPEKSGIVGIKILRSYSLQ